MKIAQLMSKNVKTCRETDSLDDAARLMWDFDIGAVVVVDEAGRVTGILTDRDAFMAAYTKHAPLHELPISIAMSREVLTCRPDESDASIVKLMARNKVRRIPVVDPAQRPIGMVSLNDLALTNREIPATDIANTLAAICEHRLSAS